MPSFGIALIVGGIGLTVLAQALMAITAFSKNPISGIMCIVVPAYIIVYSKKSQTGKRLLSAWWCGLAMLVFGGVVAS